MRRLALLLAASFLGTGCVVTDSGGGGAGDIYLYWDFVKHAPAQTTTTAHTTPGFIWYDADLQNANRATRRCPESAVDTVRVIAANGAYQDYDCLMDNGTVSVQGIWIQGAPAGVNRIRLQGWRTGVAVPLYDATFDIDVLSGQAIDYVADLAGVGAPLDLQGDLTFGSGHAPYVDCAEAGSPQVGYEIWEPTFGLTVESGRVSCQNPLPLPVFADVLDLDDYGVRLIGYQGSTSTVTFDSCDMGFEHFGAQTQQNGLPVTIDLQNAPIPACQ